VATVVRRAPNPALDYQVLLGAVVLLCVLGAIMVTSASSVISFKQTGSSWELAQKQVIAMILGGISAYVLSKFSKLWLNLLTIPALLVTMPALAFVLLYGIDVHGQKNWIKVLPGWQFQPSELGKLTLVLVSAQLVAFGLSRGWPQWASTLAVSCIGGAIIVLVLLERDLGTPIILAGIFMSILFVSGVRKRTVGALAFLGAALVVGYSFTGPDYRAARFLSWLHPDSYASSYGWQLRHGQYALALGGPMGVGLGQSSEKWGALPAPHTDFILAVIGEEMGLFGTMVVMGLLATVIWMGYRISENAEDNYQRMVAFGISTWFAIQTIVNVGAVVQVLPITGVPLPFVSYGGSSLIPGLSAIGILLAIAKRSRERAMIDADGDEFDDSDEVGR